MKALILAAGKGSRLGKITEQLPKPMIKFKGKPILQHNIELCKKYGITDIFINTSHLADVIKSYFGNGKSLGVNITYSFEENLLGTSGALNNFRNLIRNDDFFVIYGDNYSEINLQELIVIKENFKPIGVIAFHHRDDVSSSGVAEFSDNLKIVKFIEKPQIGQTNSNWVNAGIYLFTSEILKYIPIGFSDFGKDIFPYLLDKDIYICGYCNETDVLSFDTPEFLIKNQK